MSRADDDGDNLLNFREFANYMLEHEHNLKLVFKKMDVDKDGAITLHEIQVVVDYALSIKIHHWSFQLLLI